MESILTYVVIGLFVAAGAMTFWAPERDETEGAGRRWPRIPLLLAVIGLSILIASYLLWGV